MLDRRCYLLIECSKGREIVTLTAQQLALQQRYEQALIDYQATWQHIDFSLRELVDQHSWSTLADVHTKVVFVDGVYRSALVRVLGRGAYMKCATALLATAPNLQPTVSALSQFNGQLDVEAAMAAVEAHGQVLNVLPTSKKGKRPRSFASKFLHFHKEVVPLYDRRVRINAPNLLSFAGVSATDFTTALNRHPLPHGADPVYHEHVIRVLLLWQALEVVLAPGTLTVKGIDQMLFLG